MFEVTGKHIAELDDEALRSLVVRLCEAELRSNRAPLKAVTAGGNQDAADGGIDVRVHLDRSLSGRWDFIPRSQTGFQVKRQDMPAGDLKTEMRPHGELRQSIAALVAANGAYVMVASRGSVADKPLLERLEVMRQLVSDQPAAADFYVDFYDRERLARWAGCYPGVELWLRNQVGDPLSGWKPHGEWAHRSGGLAFSFDERKNFLVRATNESLSTLEGIDRLRAVLAQPGKCARLVGLSGAGKTRMAQALFETINVDDQPLDSAIAVYVDSGLPHEPTARDMLASMCVSGQRAVLVIDNCNAQTHRDLEQILSRRPGLVSLLTIEYDIRDDEPEGTEGYLLGESSHALISEVLAHAHPHVSAVDRTRIADFSSGNFRMGLTLARTLKPGKSLGALTDLDLVERIFQGQAADISLMRDSRILSLPYSFSTELGRSNSSELDVLADLAGTQPERLYEQAARLVELGVAQTRGPWRAILPQAVAIRLATEALRHLPLERIDRAMWSHERLLLSFSRRLGDLDSPQARELAARWLECPSRVGDFSNLDELRRAVLFNIAPIAPRRVLEKIASLQQTDPTFLSDAVFTFRRWSTLCSHLAYSADDFDLAAEVMSQQALAEPPERTDCKRLYDELFQFVFSGTCATPAQRAAFIRRAIKSDDGARRDIAIRAAGTMLKAADFTSARDFSFGGQSRSYGWIAETRDDEREWFDCAFVLAEEIAALDEKSNTLMSRRLGQEFRGLLRYAHLRPALFKLTRRISGADGWFAAKRALKFDAARLNPETVEELRRLRDELEPRTLRQEVLAFFAGQPSWSFDDDDEEATGEGPLDSYQRLQCRTVQLGRRLSREEQVLLEVMSSVMVEDPTRGHMLGVGIGESTPDPKTTWRMLRECFEQSSRSTRNPGALAGFIRGVSARGEWIETLLDGLVCDLALGPYFPYLQGNAITARAVERLDRAVDAGLAPASAIAGFMGLEHEPSVVGASAKRYAEVCRRVASMAGGVSAALSSLSNELDALRRSGAEPPDELVLLGLELLSRVSFDDRVPHLAYSAVAVAKVCLKDHRAGPAALSLARTLVSALEDYRSNAEDHRELACLLFAHRPGEALRALAEKRRSSALFPPLQDFSGRSRSAVECAGVGATLEWIKEDPGQRAPLIASEIDVLNPDDTVGVALSSLAEGVIALAPDKPAVLEALSHSFVPRSWSGRLEDMLKPHLHLVSRLRSDERAAIATWAEQLAETMDSRIALDRQRHSAREQSFE